MHRNMLAIGENPTRAARVLGQPAALAFLASPGFPVPDRIALRRVGSTDAEDFLATGLLLRSALEDAGGLHPDDAVFDIGCGWGRLAMPLAPALSSRGRYLGMDAAAEAIAWCRRNVGEADARFRFHHADIRNSYANPRGSIAARDAVLLPWEERFDRIAAFSLFTHLLPDAMVRYFAEAARLCRPGGVLVATFFLLNTATRAAIEAGQADRDFPAAHGIARLGNPAVPEDAVAYDVDEVIALLDAAGFDAAWRPGAWCRRGVEPFDYQDLVIARRRGAVPAAIGTRGAVQAIAGGAIRGWAWDAATGMAPGLRLEIGGEVVAEGDAGEMLRAAPPDGPPANAAAGFVLAVPPHLVGRPLRDVRLLAGPEALPLLARPALLLADPAEELARAWRCEALRDGLWRIDAVMRQDDGGWRARLWAVPPRGSPPIAPPSLYLGGGRIPLQSLDGGDAELDAALGFVPGTMRPHYGVEVPATLAARGGPWRLGLAADRQWAPHEGLLPPPRGDEAAAAACIMAATGRSLASFQPPLELAPSSPVEAPAGPVTLAMALSGLEAEDEAALVDRLAATLAPGGLLLFGTPGAAALVGGAGGVARLLHWQRHGTAQAPEAPPGRRRLRARAHVEARWGGAFALLDLREAALSGMRNLLLLQRR
jgi:SAM-dependent methyltransferase